MRTQYLRYYTACLLAISAFAPELHAEIHCVDSTAALQAAIAEIGLPSSSGEQTLRLQAGTYDVSGTELRIERSITDSSLTIEGGFDPGCPLPKSALGAQRTVITNTPWMILADTGDVALRDITIHGPVVLDSAQGAVIADRVVSNADVFGLDVFQAITRGDGEIRLRNILVTATGNNCALLAVNFAHGTVALEHVTAAAESGSGICLDGFDSVLQIGMTNSIAETLSGSQDLLINTTAPTYLASNVYGTLPPNLPPDATGNVVAGWEIFSTTALSNASPDFSLNGPVIDRADPALTTTAIDVFGNPRLYGRPDIGAIETDRILGAAF